MKLLGAHYYRYFGTNDWQRASNASHALAALLVVLAGLAHRLF